MSRSTLITTKDGAHYYEYFTNQGSANTRAHRTGVMGTDCDVDKISKKVVIVDDEFFILGDQVATHYEDPQEVRKRALSKLTPEERAALGLK